MSVYFQFNLPQGVDRPVGCDGHVCPDPLGPCVDDLLYYGICDHMEAARAECCCEKFIVNVANANAAMIFDRLDIDVADDFCGVIDAQDLIARAMLANVGRDDSGVDVMSDGGPGTGRAAWHDHGLRPGYFADVMERLADLGKAAHDRGYSVAYF